MHSFNLSFLVYPVGFRPSIVSIPGATLSKYKNVRSLSLCQDLCRELPACVGYSLTTLICTLYSSLNKVNGPEVQQLPPDTPVVYEKITDVKKMEKDGGCKCFVCY